MKSYCTQFDRDYKNIIIRIHVNQPVKWKVRVFVFLFFVAHLNNHQLKLDMHNLFGKPTKMQSPFGFSGASTCNQKINVCLVVLERAEFVPDFSTNIIRSMGTNCP